MLALRQGSAHLAAERVRACVPQRGRRCHSARVAMPALAEPTPKSSALPKVLALHGFRTSGQILQQQVTMSGLREFFRDRVDITYLDGPFPASGEAAADVKQFFQPPFHEWYNVNTDPVTGEKTYVGDGNALDHVHAHMVEHGPYAGLLGFSQGATLAGYISLLQQTGQSFQDVPPLQFLMLISGSIRPGPKFQHLYQDAKVQTPAVLVIGDKDPQRVANDLLVESVHEPLVLRHPRGHLVPRLTEEQQQQLGAFLDTHSRAPVAA